MTEAETEVWVWEYGTLDGRTVYTVNEYPTLDELKKSVDDSFTDYTWEEVERREIRGTSILVKRRNRYEEDTGHWVYRDPQRADQLPTAHSCDNCDGIGPDSCLFNENRRG